MTLRVVIIVFALDIILLLLGIFHLWMSKRLRRFAVPIIRTGIAPKGSGFHGQPEEDKEVHRAIGYFFMYGVIYWYVAGWFLLLMIPILSVGVLYLDLFIFV